MESLLLKPIQDDELVELGSKLKEYKSTPEEAIKILKIL